jgi:hypothetical protein
MTVVKRSGDPPAISTDLRRDIRQGLHQVDNMRIAAALKTAKTAAADAAMAELVATAAAADVRSMSPQDYRKAKARMLTLTRRALDPRP